MKEIRVRVLPCCVILLLATGCAQNRPNGEAWGGNTTASPGWAAIKRAAVDAAADPGTWAPALGAAVLQIGNADEDFAENVRRDKPLFGSAETAADASDWLRLGTLGLYTGLGLAAPGPEDPSDWRSAKARGFMTGFTALGATIGTTSALKSLTDRTRPNRENDRSLPSGHASITAAGARLAADTLDYYSLNQYERLAARAGFVTLTAGTAWARIEAGKHYPSDVLLGAALGNFIARFTTEAFLHPDVRERTAIYAEPLPDGGFLTLHLMY